MSADSGISYSSSDSSSAYIGSYPVSSSGYSYSSSNSSSSYPESSSRYSYASCSGPSPSNSSTYSSSSKMNSSYSASSHSSWNSVIFSSIFFVGLPKRPFDLLILFLPSPNPKPSEPNFICRRAGYAVRIVPLFTAFTAVQYNIETAVGSRKNGIFIKY